MDIITKFDRIKDISVALMEDTLALDILKMFQKVKYIALIDK